MKKVFGICAIALAGVMIFASCGKSCNCTRYENGKKVRVTSSAPDGVRYFNTSVCKNMSSSAEKGYTLESQAANPGEYDKWVECTVEVKCK